MSDDKKYDEVTHALETAHSTMGMRGDLQHTMAMAQFYATIAIACALRDIRDEIREVRKKAEG